MRKQRILIQGAMDIEVEVLLSELNDCKKNEYAGFSFFEGTLNDLPIVICKTGMGIINATIATMEGITKYSPCCVINQGTAGGHADWVHTGDLVLCEKAEYLNSFRMPLKGEGEGSNSLEWVFDEHMETRCADMKLADYFSGISYEHGKVHRGCIGSGDLYSRETDRIRWIHEKKGNLCEDMETYGVYETCYRMGVPCVGLRVVSNHEIFREPFQEETAKWLQKYLISAIGKGILA